jgi:outer membrane lipoprotein
MNKMVYRFRFAALATTCLLLLAGCASIPAPLAGDFPEFQPNQATERSIGARVRWGGHIVATRPDADRTCIEILARDLDRDLRPIAGDHHHGRFLACRDGFQDPAVFTENRAVTVVGRLQSFEIAPIGEFEYRYPLLDAEIIYLWPQRSEVVYYSDPWWPHYDPWWPYRPYRHPPPRTRVSGQVIIIR